MGHTLIDKDNPTCCCGHTFEEHGGDPQFPGATNCQIDDCGCCCFEDAGEDEGEDEGEGYE